MDTLFLLAAYVFVLCGVLGLLAGLSDWIADRAERTGARRGREQFEARQEIQPRG